MYTYKEVYKASLEYFNGNELAAKVFADKYALKNQNEFDELTPADMHKRIAKEIARVEKDKFGDDAYTEDFIFSLLDKYQCIIPQGSPIYGIGNPYAIVSLSNCFVVDSPLDSYSDILRIDEHIAQISKRRGGVGVCLDNLRPKDTPTRNSSQTSTGVLSWMSRYSNTIREVGQSGRRGALMETLSVHHPDISIFMKAKSDLSAVTGANVSVKYTDEFLNAVEKEQQYEQRWPVDPNQSLAKDNGLNAVSRKVSANEIWNEAVHQAWAHAEPGILFWDNILRESPADCYEGFETIGTNPCAEIPLSAYDSCRLLAINLMYFVENAFEDNAYFDFVKFFEHTQIAQRIMDDIVDLEIEAIHRIIEKINNDPESDFIKARELELWNNVLKTCTTGRRTGVGITALGDVLASIGVQYGSNESLEVVEKIYQTLKFGCYRQSIELAKQFGPFEVWNHKKEKDCPFFTRWKDEELALTNDGENATLIYGKKLYANMKKYGRRHIALLTTAPTGTISTQAGYKVKDKWYFGTSSGIEPVYQTSYTRRKKGNPSDKDFRSDFVDQNGDHWMEFKVYHEGVKAFMDVTGEEEDASSYFNACAPDIDWVKRVELQAAAGKHVDHSISSTVNLPEHVDEETVNKIFMTAWRSGLKGITVYRDGCRSGVLVEEKKGIPKHDAPKRPKELECDVHRIVVKGQPYYVLVGLMDGEPYETFAGQDGFLDTNVKHGKIIKMGRPKCYKAILDDGIEISPLHAMADENEEALMRMTSTALRHGAELEFIITQLSKTKGEMTSFAKAVARALKKYVDGKESKEDCPDCQGKLIFAEGCLKCNSCGFSKCS